MNAYIHIGQAKFEIFDHRQFARVANAHMHLILIEL
jgi:hypothetical protein